MNQREQYEKETGKPATFVKPDLMNNSGERLYTQDFCKWLLERLSNIPTPEEIQTMAEEYSPLYKQPLQNIAFTDGANVVIEKIKG